VLAILPILSFKRSLNAGATVITAALFSQQQRQRSCQSSHAVLQFESPKQLLI
jgi:hypothetical protein